MMCGNCGKWVEREQGDWAYAFGDDVFLCNECLKPAEYMTIEDCRKCKHFKSTGICLIDNEKIMKEFVCGKFEAGKNL